MSWNAEKERELASLTVESDRMKSRMNDLVVERDTAFRAVGMLVNKQSPCMTGESLFKNAAEIVALLGPMVEKGDPGADYIRMMNESAAAQKKQADQLQALQGHQSAMDQAASDAVYLPRPLTSSPWFGRAEISPTSEPHDPSDPHAALRASYRPGQKWEWTHAGDVHGDFWEDMHAGRQPAWFPSNRYRLKADQS